MNNPIPSRPADLPQGGWTEAAVRVLTERYTLKDEAGRTLETPDDVMWRVASTIAAVDRTFGAADEQVMRTARRFYELMVRGKFMPNSPTLMNAGKPHGLQWAACYVLPIPDDLSGIFMTMHDAALIHQAAGGTGFAYSRLRPKNSRVRTTSGVSSGPVSFLRVYNAATEHVKQGASRRGANMAILRCDHPDLLEFVHCKRDGSIANFNISVAITDAFMRAVDHREKYPLLAQPGWPLPGGARARGGEILGELDAGEVWRTICEAAWATGDPGLFFIDHVNASPANAVPALQTIEASNPCGEQSLPPYGACTLGHLNLAAFAREGQLDWDALAVATRDAVTFLDNVVEANPYTLPAIQEQALNERRIGLGVMGWADLLFALAIPYASHDAVELARQLGQFVLAAAQQASHALASERGPFPWFAQSIYKDGPPRRNSNITTIAPTGCLAPETLISTEGGLVSLGTLGRCDGPQWQGLALRVATDRQPELATKFFVNGRHDCICVTTKSGFTLVGTRDHRIRGLDPEAGQYSWFRLAELAEGVPVALVLGHDFSTADVKLEPWEEPPHFNSTPVRFPETMTVALAEILGWYMGDGYLKKRGGLHIAVPKDAPALLCTIRDRIEHVFGLETTIEDRPGCVIVNAASRMLFGWFHLNGFAKAPGNFGEGSASAFIPASVLASPPDVLQAFLRGLFDADGSVTRNARCRTVLVEFSTVSETLARQVHQALLAVGIVARLRTATAHARRLGRRTRYEIWPVNKNFTRRFAAIIGSNHERKARRLADELARSHGDDNSQACRGDNLYGRQLLEDIRDHVRQWLGRRHPLFFSAVAAVQRGRMTKALVRRILVSTPPLDRDLAPLMPVFFDQVLRTERVESDTYDLSVPVGNTYIANGFVSHNTVSMFAGCSSGIEPLFALAFQHRVRQPDGSTRVLTFINAAVRQALAMRGLDTPEILAELERRGTLRDIAGVPEELRGVFATAHEIPVEWHVQHQAAWQTSFSESSVSKTINLPNAATVEDVARAYRLAWDTGCLGITVFRDGCKSEQVLHVGASRSAALSSEAAPPAETKLIPLVEPRPRRVRGETWEVQSPLGEVYVTLNVTADGDPFEIFVRVGKSGTDIEAFAEALGRLMSNFLRHTRLPDRKTRLAKIVKQLSGIGGSGHIGFGPNRIRSVPDAIARALSEFLAPEEAEPFGLVNGGGATPLEPPTPVGDMCPKCGNATFVYEEGCQKCHSCLHSEC